MRLRPEARYVIFYSFAHGGGEHAGLYYDAHKIEHMYHDNSILAYEMNGKPLSELLELRCAFAMNSNSASNT